MRTKMTMKVLTDRSACDADPTHVTYGSPTVIVKIGTEEKPSLMFFLCAGCFEAFVALVSNVGPNMIAGLEQEDEGSDLWKSLFLESPKSED